MVVRSASRSLSLISICILALSLGGCNGENSSSTLANPGATISGPADADGGNTGTGTGSGSGNLTVDAGPDQTVNGSQSVSLTATTNASNPSYQWNFEWKPTGSSLTDADLSRANKATVAFTPDLVGNYLLKVTARENGNIVSDEATVTADEIWRPLGTADLSAGGAEYTSLAVAPDGASYIAYVDDSHGGKVTVKKYNRKRSQWVLVGGAGFSPDKAQFTSLAIAPDGTPYVAYADGSRGNKITVMKYNNAIGQWQAVGDVGFSHDAASNISLAIGPYGKPYVAYSTTGLFSDVVVVQANSGGEWVTIGGDLWDIPSYSALTHRIPFAIAPDGTLYVVCGDTASSSTAVVAKYTGLGWSVVGGQGFLLSTVAATSLAVSPNGTVYVLYVDRSNDHHAGVALYNNSLGWIITAYAKPLGGVAGYPSLIFAPDGTPYVAFRDYANGGRVTVMTFDASYWSRVGTTGLSDAPVVHASLAVAPGGAPIVAYEDISNNGRVFAQRLTTVAPQVTRIHPGRGALRVSKNPAITVTFDGPMDATSLTSTASFQVQDESGVVSPASVTYDAATHTETYVPARTLNGEVNVTLTGNIRDADGHAFNGMQWQFRVPLWEAVGSAGLSAGKAQHTSLAIAPDGTAYVAYNDGENDGKVTVMKYDVRSHQWAGVGNAGFSMGAAFYVSLAIAPNGTPYVAYDDVANGFKATVMRYDGASGQWLNVGSAGFSAGSVSYTSLAFAADGMPYVAYREFHDHHYVATLMKYQSAVQQWVNVGSAGASFLRGANYMSLAIAPDGTPYMAYVQAGAAYQALVVKYTGRKWMAVGDTGIAAGASYTSLAISPDGTPYVAFVDDAHGHAATVVKYTGTKWETVGSAGFSAGLAGYTSLAIAPDGTPYLACDGGVHRTAATVMKYDGDSRNWVGVGSPGFSSGLAKSLSLAIAPDGTPYVAYEDWGTGRKATVMKLQ